MSNQNQAAHDAAKAAAVAADKPANVHDKQHVGKRRSVDSEKDTGAAGYADDELETELEHFKPLTRQEVDEVRRRIRSVSMLQVLVAQMVAGIVVAVVSWIVTGRQNAGWSAFYGALAVIVPAALFARGLSRQKAVSGAGSALVGFFVWELVKVGTTVAMLLVAPRLVSQLSWLALLAGFVVTMKVYWLATWVQLARTKSVKKI